MISKKLILLGVVGIVSSGLLLAQAHRGPFGMGGGHGKFREFIADYLDLTDAQKAQTQAIFENARTSAQPTVEKLKAGHDEMATAIKSGASDNDLKAIADRQGDLVGQLATVHAQAFSKFYALLTPEQKEKAEKLHGMIKERMQNRLGGRGPF